MEINAEEKAKEPATKSCSPEVLSISDRKATVTKEMKKASKNETALGVANIAE